MGLETATYISGLNASNPIHATDQVSQGDDHLRLIKSTLLASFPNITGAMTASHTELNYLDGATGVTGTGSVVLSASPTFTGTLTAATLVATTYAGIASANLVDKSASETISGTTWDFQAITAVTFGGIASANLVDKSAAETISGAWTFGVITATSYDGIPATNLLSEIAAIDTTVSNTDAAQPGYKGTPQRNISASDSLVLTDAGKRIYITGGASQTLTIPANASVAFPIGTIIECINDSGNNWSIAITSDTLEKLGGSTGTQTLTDNNKAVFEKVTSTLWKYSSSD
jgi:hypothetical protein